MTQCHDIQPQLTAWVDDDLEIDARARVAAHLDRCEACAGLVRDLEALQRAARSLGPIVPPPHLFRAIASRVPAADPGGGWLGVAAAVAIVVMGSYAVVRFDRHPAAVARMASNAPAPIAVEAGGDEWRVMVTHYEQAIAALEVATSRGERLAASPVAETLRSDMTAVDAAIDESRAAVTSDPESQPARDSLSDALRRKVSVLQATVAVINDSPKGD